jgi:hypothetical protein
MVVNFRIREISRGAHKLTQTPTLIIKKKVIKRGVVQLEVLYSIYNIFLLNIIFFV